METLDNLLSEEDSDTEYTLFEQAIAFMQGEIVDKDFAMARKLMHLAASDGDERAVTFIKENKSFMKQNGNKEVEEEYTEDDKEFNWFALAVGTLITFLILLGVSLVLGIWLKYFGWIFWTAAVIGVASYVALSIAAVKCVDEGYDGAFMWILRFIAFIGYATVVIIKAFIVDDAVADIKKTAKSEKFQIKHIEMRTFGNFIKTEDKKTLEIGEWYKGGDTAVGIGENNKGVEYWGLKDVKIVEKYSNTH